MFQNKLWYGFLGLFSYPFIAYYLINPLFGNVVAEWYGMTEILHYLIICTGVWFTFTSKITIKTFAFIIGTTFILDVTKVFYSIADWLFFDSVFSKPLENFGAKDQDAIFMALAIIFWFINIVLFIYNRVKTKKLELNRIFMIMGTTAILILTTVFHWYAIEFNYLNIKKEVIHEMKLTTKESKNDFHVICKFKKWVCSYRDEDPMLVINNFPNEMKEVYVDTALPNKSPEIAANFTVLQANSDDRHRYITYRYDNMWLTDKNRFKAGFDVAEQTFLSLTFLAHFFWLNFVFFLMIFHEDRIKKRLAVLSKS